MLRDRIAEVIERNADAIDQPYNMADAVLSAMRGWIDRLDQTLYDVIPRTTGASCWRATMSDSICTDGPCWRRHAGRRTPR